MKISKDRIKTDFRLAGLVGALTYLALAAAQIADASEIRKPDCAALEKWAVTIGQKDRVNPVQGDRAWLPRSFLDPSFAELFGLAALEWKSSDARVMGGHLHTCGKAAGKARRTAARNALYAARGYMTGNLRGVLALRERAARNKARDAARAERIAARRAQQDARMAEERDRLAARQRTQRDAKAPAARGRDDAAVEAALEKVLAEKDPRRLLRTLSRMRDVDVQDMNSYNRASMRLGVAPRNLLYILRRQGRNMDDPLVAPKLEARHKELRAGIVEDYKSRIAKLDATPDGLRFLDRWQGEVQRNVVPLVGADGAAPILAAIDERRQAIRSGFVPKAIVAIDKIADDPRDDIGALRRIDRIVINMEKSGVSRTQLAELTAHARNRRQPIADRALKAELGKLDDYPETLEGLKQLLRLVKRVKDGVLAGSSPGLKTDYLEKARERLADIGDDALPEFKGGLSAVPESSAGLAMLNSSIVSDPGFQEVPAKVREAYTLALSERRQQVQAALESKRAMQRKTAIRAGGNPDLVGYWFANKKSGIRIGFKNEKVAIVTLKGKMDAAPYEITGNRIKITTPGLPMLFAVSGSGMQTKLEGLGMQFERVTN